MSIDVVVVQPDLTQNALHIRKEDYCEKSILASLGANAVVPLLPPPPKYMNNNCQKDETHLPLIGKLQNGSLNSTEKIPRPESPASEVNSSGMCKYFHELNLHCVCVVISKMNPLHKTIASDATRYWFRLEVFVKFGISKSFSKLKGVTIRFRCKTIKVTLTGRHQSFNVPFPVAYWQKCLINSSAAYIRFPVLFTFCACMFFLPDSIANLQNVNKRELPPLALGINKMFIFTLPHFSILPNSYITI